MQIKYMGAIMRVAMYYSNSDVRLQDLPMPEIGDVVAFMTTGAYVKAMEMTGYNTRLPVPELLLVGGESYSLTKEEVVSKTIML